MRPIYLTGTADTKGEELAFVRAILLASGQDVRLVNIGTRAPTIPVDITADEVAAHHPKGAPHILNSDDRGLAVAAMGEAFCNFCRTHAADIGAVMGMGGGGGTAMITPGMRELPYGVPKVMVSTLASGDVAPYVDVSDIAMFPSVTDIAGLNRLSRQILANAAAAVIGMMQRPALPKVTEKPSIGLTMFGVTTPAVMAISESLRDRFDCQVFHATGTGGRAMERLVKDGYIGGLIDLTTTELCDLLVGGVLPCDPDRLNVVAQTQVPYVGSVGALDMVNFWAPDTVPAHLKDRQFYHHNPNVTLMRTTPAENAQMGRWIGEKLNRCDGPVRFLLPLKGVSALDTEGGDFFDPEADAALFDALRDTIIQTDNRRIVELPYHINDPEFAEATVAAFLDISKD